ncbi:hypothetical protein AR457_27305 [Streptomyces agglomeratus]|uniref:hypothetical protein n=1 Tax=Streptomyces agglomeratus TaxID=285458 RepID=UPI000854AFDD|nr:hypothetical protein [Streptomyces agglomeratus]OEJ38322.1 hypothetical protein BGK70_09350 [Streptomyces agglomeratus]OEJ47294.1 hypothetical protein AR457_27305 [Streptomyces agglomeratus]OEJ50850.1 hypothetical protein BGK72_08835 [Streptomyces agglomeratus]OEJ58213.1 hypothetical protein BGM19_09700 [Streptomyces agglomeratus]
MWRCGDWLTHYNSACAYAMAMRAADGDPHVTEGHVRRAVEELEKAVLVPKGGFMTVERTWMVHEDPDLDLLRNEELFKSFVRTAYPGLETAADAPPADNWSEKQMRSYDYRLLEAVAKVMQQVWNLRGAERGADIRVATEWLRSECEIWAGIHGVTGFDRCGQWEDRVDLIGHVQANRQPDLFFAPEFPPPLLSDGPAADDLPSDIDQRLERLARDLECEEGEGGVLHLSSRQGQDVLREATANGVARLSRASVRKLATGYSALWQTLGEWLGPADRGEEPFLHALKGVPRPTRRRRASRRSIVLDPTRVRI